MTIDEVIKEFTDLAKDERKEQNFWLAQRNEIDETSLSSYADCYSSFARDSETRAERYEQLAKWLTELKEAKQLLSMAVKSFDKLKETVIPFRHVMCDYAMQFANPYDACNSCPLANVRYKTCKWRFANEAMELIGGESNGI